MKVMLYLIESANGVTDHLEKIIGDMVPGGDFLVCRSLRDLTQRLRRLSEKYEIVVLVATNNQELEELVAFQDLLKDLRVILVLPDRKKDTVAKGFKLYPRYVSYADSDFTDIAAVLTKMLKLIQSEKIYKKEVKQEWQN